ncbi:MAG: GNAT family N-acetyltransferase [Streptosporangiales bacterium]|nr:GNAT family N-acetyltransferase [Streptosporangiales bacterium]
MRCGRQYGRVPIRRLRPDEAGACAEIVLSLPDYFTDDVPDKVREGFAAHEAWGLTDPGAGAAPDPGAGGGAPVQEDRVVGFAIVERRSARAAEITWMAVGREWRGAGRGTRLLERVLDGLAAEGVSLVEVKTLDGSAGYAPYEATRAFWERRGFVQIDTIDPLPGWQPGNPAAICVAALRPTAAAGSG